MVYVIESKWEEEIKGKKNNKDGHIPGKVERSLLKLEKDVLRSKYSGKKKFTQNLDKKPEGLVAKANDKVGSTENYNYNKYKAGVGEFISPKSNIVRSKIRDAKELAVPTAGISIMAPAAQAFGPAGKAVAAAMVATPAIAAGKYKADRVLNMNTVKPEVLKAKADAEQAKKQASKFDTKEYSAEEREALKKKATPKQSEEKKEKKKFFDIPIPAMA